MMKKIAIGILLIVWIIVSAVFFSKADQSEIVWGKNLPYSHMAALGFIEDTTTRHMFGFNPDVDAAEESIWDLHDIPSAGAGPTHCFGLGQTPVDLYISSDDDADAGKLIQIEHLDGNYDETVTTMVLGVAAATSGTVFTQIGSDPILRVNRIQALNEGYVGNIYIHQDDIDGGDDGIPDTPATDIIAGIVAGNNQTLQACYSTPNGYRILLTNICFTNNDVSASPDLVEFHAHISTPLITQRIIAKVGIGDGVTLCRTFDPPLLGPEKGDIDFIGVAVGAGTNQSATITFAMIIRPSS
jgi:hypothetical protein